MGDQFSNSSVADQIWPLRFLARFVGGGLGYRCNSKPEMVYVRDRAAWIRSIREALEECAPAIVVPAHGDPVTEDAVVRTRRAIDAVDAKVARRD
jgi:glyoxylase-like metal-dependent hydrolase (beta-lactamase superfamily II)